VAKRKVELAGQAGLALPNVVRPDQRALRNDDQESRHGRWHAHEGRHTAVSIMSSNGIPIQDISDTVGHKSTHVTETVYRHVIVPEIRGGATMMDDIFDDEDGQDEGKEEAKSI
jgi:integrase